MPLMTEEQAEKITCEECMSSVEVVEVWCFGPGCSAWRWWDPEEHAVPERRGYCGKSGKPGPGEL